MGWGRAGIMSSRMGCRLMGGELGEWVNGG